MSMGQGGPSFDDVPDFAAPNKSVTASYTYRDRSQSPLYSDPDDQSAVGPGPGTGTGTGRRSLESPYQYARGRQSWDSEREMNDHGHAHGYPHRTRERSAELPRLQLNGTLDQLDQEDYNPITDDDPTSYDLTGPAPAEDTGKGAWNLEKQSQALFSKEHLQIIFGDPSYLLRFTSFLGMHRPTSVPILVHYLDSLKALRALHYANAILEGLDEVSGLPFTKTSVDPTTNAALLKRATDAFDHLVKEELPAFVTHEYIQIVSASISARISGMLAPHLREASEGLAEVFCLTDPSRPDNPIVFASEEFNRTTQYGLSYVLGRNCRFLQGPHTNPLSVRRLRDSVLAGKQHQEVFLNYRRDGSPFMNLLMTAPLCDARGVVRYFIGAQVDVTGLVKDCADMESLERLLDKQARGESVPDHQQPNPEKNDELRELSEMLNTNELSTIRKFGGRMHRDVDSDDNDSDNHSNSVASAQPRLLIKDPNTMTPPWHIGEPTIDETLEASGSGMSSSPVNGKTSGRLSGVYNHYLLIRPYPSLRILFASPSQRVPGILQSPFMNKIGGSNRVREELTAAFADGRGVTAKVRWLTRNDEEGRNRWIHCTPLIGVNGQIGVWMVVIVDDERHRLQRERERMGGRSAPPVPSDLRDRATPDRYERDLGRVKEREKQQTSYHKVTSQSQSREQNQHQNAAPQHRYEYSAGGGARGSTTTNGNSNGHGHGQGHGLYHEATSSNRNDSSGALSHGNQSLESFKI